MSDRLIADLVAQRASWGWLANFVAIAMTTSSSASLSATTSASDMSFASFAVQFVPTK